MKQRKRNGLLPPIRTSDVLVFSSRREPFHRRDDGRVARRPSPRRVRTRTPMFKRMARRLKAMRMLERGMRFAAAPRRLDAAYEDEMDAEHMEPVEEEEEKEREETPEGSDDDGEPEDDDHPASSSDSDEVQITGEVAATPPPRGTAPLTPDTAIAFAQRALHLTLKRERGHGNCMFCAFSSGLNSWLDAGERATPSWREYVKPGSNEREDPSTLHGKVTGSNRGGIEWSHLRAALVQALKQTVRDAKKRDRDRVMNELCAGEEGRAWLHRGKFASALPYERFHAHLEVMSKDAAPHSGRSRWTRFWGTDVEVTALAAALAFGLGGFAGGSALRQVVLATRRQGWRGLVGRTNGGMVVHLGVVLIAIAFAASNAYVRQGEFTMAVGDTAQISGHTLTYEGSRLTEYSNRTEKSARVLVDEAKVYEPAIAQYPFAGRTIGIPSVRSTWTDDIALSVLTFPEGSGDTVVLRATVQPLIVWLWIGGLVMAAGTVLAVVPGKRRRPTAPTSAPPTSHEVLL